MGIDKLWAAEDGMSSISNFDSSNIIDYGLRIHGPTGLGKTILLVYRAIQLQTAARAGKPNHVLC
jgi:RecA-family ATPase